jgi:hypothetical protein
LQRTSNHLKTSQHATIQGFDKSGGLSFTCHLTEDPGKDEAWIYWVMQIDECVVEGEEGVVVLKSKYGVAVKVQTLVKLSKKNFFSLETEYICGTPLLTYTMFQLNV